MATAFGPGIRALSVYNVNDGTTIQIDGADISPESTIEESKTTRTSAKGNMSKLMTVWELNVQFADPSGFSSLDSADSQTREWQVVAAGVNGKNLQWYEDSTFIVENSIETDPAADSNFPYTLRIRHISESPAIYNNVNLLAYLGWKDTDSDGLADGYNSNIGGTTFVGPNQTFNRLSGDPALGIIQAIIHFPITGVRLTQSVNWHQLTDQINENRIAFLNFAETNISSKLTSVTAGGINTTIDTSISATFSIAAGIVVVTGVITAVTGKVRYPALTTNGAITPGDKFMNY